MWLKVGDTTVMYQAIESIAYEAMSRDVIVRTVSGKEHRYRVDGMRQGEAAVSAVRERIAWSRIILARRPDQVKKPA
ncbi:MAG: hypothetical protein AB9M53_00780 [Leptothrix sp. (in: b-proteobacteria)]